MSYPYGIDRFDDFGEHGRWISNPQFGRNLSDPVELRPLFSNPGRNSAVILDVPDLGQAPRPLAISLGASLNALNLPDGTNFNPIARCTFGSGAGIQQVEVDFKAGTQFVVVGTTIKVEAFIDGAPSLAPGLTTEQVAALGIQLSASMGFAGLGPRGRPTRTRGPFQIGAAPNDVVVDPIPAFAACCVPVAPDPNEVYAGANNFGFLANSTPTANNRIAVYEADTLEDPAAFCSGAVIPGLARFAFYEGIGGNGAGTVTDLRLVYYLDL